MSYHQWTIDTIDNAGIHVSKMANKPKVGARLPTMAEQMTCMAFPPASYDPPGNGFFTTKDRHATDMQTTVHLSDLPYMTEFIDATDGSFLLAFQTAMQNLSQSHEGAHHRVQPATKDSSAPPDLDRRNSTHDDDLQQFLAPLIRQQQSTVASSRKVASRDQRQSGGRPQALAATHPANYGPPPAAKSTQPSSLTMFAAKHIVQQPTPPPSIQSKSLSPRPPSPSPSVCSPPEPVWRRYTDPMWQTSSDPHYWNVNYTVLKSDRALDPGNVVSPTWMIGLPCGGMIEMAHHYPSKEALESWVEDSLL